MTELIRELIQEREDRKAISSFSSTVPYNNGYIWNVELIPLNKEYFSLSYNIALTVLKGGTYRITLHLLPLQGGQIYPYLVINGIAKMYTYANGGIGAFNTATLNVILNITSGSILTIMDQGNGNLFIDSDHRAIYNYFCVERLM